LWQGKGRGEQRKGKEARKEKGEEAGMNVGNILLRIFESCTLDVK